MSRLYKTIIRCAASIALFVIAMAPCAVLAEDGAEKGLLEARAALQDGFYEIAETRLGAWLKDRTEPKAETLEVMNLYCQALAGRGKIKEIREVVQTGKPSGLKLDGSGLAVYWGAYCDYRDGKHSAVTNALSSLPSVGWSSALSANALRLKGWSLLLLGATNDAVACFSDYEAKYAKEAGRLQNLAELGRLLLDSGDAKRAEKYLRRVHGVEGSAVDKARCLHLLGLSLRSTGKGSESRKVFERLASDEAVAADVRAEAWFEAAEIGVATGDVAGAVSACVAGLKLTQNAGLQMRGSILHGRVLIDSGKLAEGIAVLKGQVVKMTDPDQSAALQLEIARALLKAKKDLEAVGEFQSYLETFTNNTGLVDAHIGKGWGLFRLERFAEAAGEFSKAFEMGESRSLKEESLYKMGDAYLANGQYTLALEAYDRFAKEFSDSDKIKSVSFQRAEALTGSGKTEEAEQQYELIIDKYGDSNIGAEARLKIGRMKFDRKDVAGAVLDFEAVMKAFPKTEYYVRALHGRAKTYFSTGDYRKALNDLERITSRHGGSDSAEDAMYEKALCFHRMGETARAEQAFSDFLAKYPESSWAPDIVFWQGEQQFNKGEFEAAEKVFTGFAKKYPDSVLVAEALLRSGMSASGRKEYVHAIELFNKLAKDHSSSIRIPDARFAQANALCELGRFSEAILPLDEIINKYPDCELVIPAWGRKGDCHFVMGSEDKKRYEESIQSYRVVASSSKATQSMIFQSEYKIGRSLEKLGKVNEALERYYSRVMIPFLEQKEAGEKHDESSRIWFTRASLGAASILESQKDWRRAANVLERLAGSGVPASREAGARAKKIRAENWWLFY